MNLVWMEKGSLLWISHLLDRLLSLGEQISNSANTQNVVQPVYLLRMAFFASKSKNFYWTDATF